MNKFSGSIYDSITIACSMFSPHDLMAHADEIRNQVNEIKKNNLTYQDYTYAATGSKNRVIGRIMMIYQLIENIIGNTNSSQRLYSKSTKEELWYEGYVCPYCNQQILSIDDAEVDHIIPYSKGGNTVIDNAQLLHRHCNREKNNSEFETNDINEIELENVINN